ncbi:phosphatidylinositol-glycan biosynthesis class f protein-related [Holotrichia oblita]|uniref:Phosphatidylinositol-glycan biosynthesis class f protein-related n=1 Tax=Holotrichia oblita TaxID=644536 RepID=A0ACB9T6F5_HOLOL|nr:phosphatidylinositol-glycan biosynthesis class f protein-related [Holotrichia oblita]
MACLICGLFLIASALIALKLYIKLTAKRNNSYVCLVGKTAIVTGANTGLGYVTALDLAKRGARVILACRNKDRAGKAMRKIIAATANEDVVYKLVDFASLQSVRNFSKDINENEDRLDILVNNAGIGVQNEDFTSDGIQTILEVNHVSGFLLTHLLIDKLKKSAPSRIVMVSSLMAKYSSLNLKTIDDLNTLAAANQFFGLYKNSKLCNLLFTIEMAKRLEGTGITINATHPGAAYTDIMNNAGETTRFIFNTIASLMYQTAEEGAQTQIYVAVANEVAQMNGEYFGNCARIEMYETAKDPELARKIWEKSEELAKLENNEKIPAMMIL